MIRCGKSCSQLSMISVIPVDQLRTALYPFSIFNRPTCIKIISLYRLDKMTLVFFRVQHNCCLRVDGLGFLSSFWWMREREADTVTVPPILSCSGWGTDREEDEKYISVRSNKLSSLGVASQCWSVQSRCEVMSPLRGWQILAFGNCVGDTNTSSCLMSSLQWYYQQIFRNKSSWILMRHDRVSTDNHCI